MPVIYTQSSIRQRPPAPKPEAAVAPVRRRCPSHMPKTKADMAARDTMIVELFNKGMNHAEIAKVVGYSNSGVALKRLQVMGLAPVARRRGSQRT